MTKPTENEQFDINQPFVTQEQKFKYWEESKAEIKRLQARAELANKQIAELQAQINAFRGALEDISKLPYTSYKWGSIAAQAISKTAPQCLQEQSAEIAQYKAQINELRGALSVIHECLMARGGDDEYLLRIVDKALAKTAPQCLQEHDNKVIERCAIRGRLAQLENKVVDTEIRALKHTS